MINQGRVGTMVSAVVNRAGDRSDFWRHVGLEAQGEAVRQAIHNGLPYRFFSTLVDYFGLSSNAVADAVGIPSTTLRRRAKAGPFTVHESDRLYRLAELLTATEAVFGGEIEAGRRWLYSPVTALGGARPIDRVATSVELQTVFECLRKIETGDFS